MKTKGYRLRKKKLFDTPMAAENPMAAAGVTVNPLFEDSNRENFNPLYNSQV